MATMTRQDVYQEVTDKIVSMLELGIKPWHQPWASANKLGPISRPLRYGGEPYKGINVVMLWISAECNNYTSPIWMTYRQAQEYGAHVRQGEHGTQVVYANTIDVKDKDATSKDAKRKFFMMRGYTVFNVDQIDDLPERFHPAPDHYTPLDESLRLAKADEFFANTGADIRHGGDRAFYRPSDDFIRMPEFATFESAESYAATLAHELVHWTSHEKRCDRSIRNAFGTTEYAKEELVAEMGSAFLCCDLRITPEPREDHASYVASWLKALTSDNRCIFHAASMAQKAVDYLHSLQPAPVVASQQTVFSW